MIGTHKTQDAMKFITMYNERVRLLYNNMKASLDALGIDVVAHQAPAAGDEWGTPEFRALVLPKLDLVTTELQGEDIVVWTDVDVVYRRDPRPYLAERLQSAYVDVVFQQEWSCGLPCTGFFAALPTDNAKALLAPAGKLKTRYPAHGDQGIVWTRLKQQARPYRWQLLPIQQFPNGAYQLNECLDSKRYLCHYNWTRSVQSKIDRMREEGDWFL
jgi:hypothetical protein